MKKTDLYEHSNIQYISTNIISRAERIKELLNKSLETYLEIAKEIRSAKEQLTKSEYEQLLEQSTLTIAKADKLLKIAETQFLFTDRATPMLSRIEGWTTLYEVSKIKSDRVDEFLTVVEQNPEQQLSRKFIGEFRENANNIPNEFMIVASVVVSMNDFLRLDTEQYFKFRESLNEAQRIIDASCIAVQMKQNQKSLEKLESKLFNQPIIENDELYEAEAQMNCSSEYLETTVQQSL